MKKVGLVCEGGGTKGAYTAGVLSCFIDQGIQIPYTVGISSGTVCLMGYLSSQIDLLKNTSINITTDKKVIGLSPIINEGQIYGIQRIFQLIEENTPFDYEKAMESPIECDTGIYNIATGEVEYYDKSYLNTDLSKASCSLLLLSKPIKLFGNEYTDGGLKIMIPIQQSIDKGNEKHIFISTKEENFVRKPAAKWQCILAGLVYRKHPHIRKNLELRHIHYEQQWNQVKNLEKEGKALILRPSQNMQISRSTQDKNKLTKWFELGYQDTLDRLEKIKQFINE